MKVLTHRYRVVVDIEIDATYMDAVVERFRANSGFAAMSDVDIARNNENGMLSAVFSDLGAMTEHPKTELVFADSAHSFTSLIEDGEGHPRYQKIRLTVTRGLSAESEFPDDLRENGLPLHTHGNVDDARNPH